MKKTTEDLRKVETYPLSRVATIDVGRIGREKHHVTGLLEVDVTLARQRIQKLIKSGQPAGFTAWVVKCVADTCAEHPAIHALNGRGRRQYLYSDVDISVPVERIVEGKRVPLAAVVRGAESKSAGAIAAELEGFRRQPVSDARDFVLGERKKSRAEALFFRLPAWGRMLFWRALLGNPDARKKAMGTVMVTNVGPGGPVTGWILPKSLHNLSLGIGSVNRKPRAAGDTVVVREILHLTVLFDHDVVDGVPAARFVSRLVANMEKAHALDEPPVRPEFSAD